MTKRRLVVMCAAVVFATVAAVLIVDRDTSYWKLSLRLIALPGTLLEIAIPPSAPARDVIEVRAIECVVNVLIWSGSAWAISAARGRARVALIIVLALAVIAWAGLVLSFR